MVSLPQGERRHRDRIAVPAVAGASNVHIIEIFKWYFSAKIAKFIP
jgi:hypothetical protein